MSHDALFQSGMDLEAPSTPRTEDTFAQDAHAETTIPGDDRKDFFIEKDGVRCAGAHLIIDLHGADHLDDLEHIERALLDCVQASGATLLHIHLHPFEPNGGVSGVAVLAESHISIHSWPETGYAALDVFMCGAAKPDACIPVLEQAFSPDRVEVKELLRGKSADQPN